MPVAWDELSPELEPASFTINTVPGIVRDRRADPWAEIGTVRQRLPS
jgi:DNA primase